MTFDEAFEILIGHEGGFTANPADNGNWTGGARGQGLLKGTKYGIAANTYPDLDIKNLTLDQAKAIYRRDYWAKCKCDDLPEGLRFDVFDTAVNAGIARAIKCLQLAVGVTADGDYGPQTDLAVRSIDPYRLLCRFNGHRLDFLNDLNVWPSFGRGWSQRIADNLMRA